MYADNPAPEFVGGAAIPHPTDLLRHAGANRKNLRQFGDTGSRQVLSRMQCILVCPGHLGLQAMHQGSMKRSI
jgi:hypothetical protein